uniref:HECT and RLD domain containing E3 ubiquitin protein ligase 4 n=1 Tax=Leptobrachium leishanense TaxID=445787 RepID=A0A8C5PVV1_9ANUR
MLCWGNAAFGQLGLGGIDEEIVIEPRKCDFFQNKNVRDVGCGSRHTVFVLDDGTVYSCGCNDLGQLGHDRGRKKPEQVGALDAQNIVAVSCGEAHTLALNDKGQVFSWGLATDGQIGLSGVEEYIRVPRNIKSLSEVQIVQVACGHHHSLALSKESEVYAWGQNRLPLEERTVLLSQCRGPYLVGVETSLDSWGLMMKLIDLLQPFSSHCGLRKLYIYVVEKIILLLLQRQHTMAFVPSSGRVYSFGLGGNGQLGTGSTCNRKSPFTVKGNWVSYCDFINHSDSAGGLYCVRKIFSGGDQSFAHYYHTKNCLPPDDFRNVKVSKQIWTLNEELIQKWLQFSSSRLPPDVMNEINKVFSSAACLNGSFLATSNIDHYRTSSKFSGIDMNAARLLLHKLISPAQPQIAQQVAASLEKNLIPKLTNSPPDIECLRVYLTLPECPLMTDGNNFSSLAIPFAVAISKLDKAPLKVLENWWSSLENPLFMKIVQLFKDVVVHLLKLTKIGIPLADRRIFNTFLNTALKVLEILHRVNEKSGQIIPYDKFYIHEIQDFIDIRNDYINWIQQQAFRMDVNPGIAEAEATVTMCTYPFVFDAQAKTTLLQTDAVIQMQMAVDQAHRQNFSSLFLPVMESVDPCLILIVRRDNIVGDAMEVLRKTKNIDYKKPLKVIFVGEEAVDAGGLRKEFFLLIMRELLDPKYGMFRYYEESRLLWFSGQTFEDSDLFHLIGVICGLAIYNFTIVDLHFPLALYKKLLKKKPSLDDLKELMPDVGRSMQQLLDYAEDDIEDAFCLNFTITVENYGSTEVRELIPNGAETLVNNKNKQEFVDAYADYLFNRSVASLFNAFAAGFHKVCGGKVLELFQPNELQAMVTGNTNYDWKELEMNTEYKGEYWADHPTIKIFWDVFHELPLEKKKQFLLFLTGSDRIPILGMKSLKLIIQPTGGGEDFLPVAHTCFNLLDLPKFKDKQTLRSKLIQAIDHYEGFNLV